MEAYLEQAWNHANIPAELANLRPHGDFVLVRVIPEPEATQSGIVLPQTKRENLSPRIGEAIAAGPGDRIWWWTCRKCGDIKKTTTKGPGKPHCGEYGWNLVAMHRHKMHVKPGDRILYWRTYANEVVLNDELYQLVHEEQHIVAVLEN